ncbi:ROK family transcriptional regulator [Rhizobium tubonense]|uniref:Sugar kinase n=1 Tax=Rhizobium tubonense TaxID=484088 RepID=A0A2W4CPY6_9HYPH|nr:ROK family transcriptional regulator [Rhizobium tubonense]PZM14649.1 sugar kinase [Rhizobium tubonense]
MKPKGYQATARAMNRCLILNLLRQHGPMSRAELAIATGLSPAAVSFVVSDLIEEKVVKDGSAVSGKTGRRPVPVQIDYDQTIALGFRLMADAVECVATDLETNIIAAMRVTLPRRVPETVVAVLVETLPKLIKLAGRPHSGLAGIGISMPAVISHDQTVCIRSHRFGWDNVPLAQLIANQVRVPVWLEDDTNAYAIAQQLFGLGRHHQNMAVLAVGVGIACAHVIEGKLYRGANGAAGRLGHTIVEPNGRPCECGKQGCLMAYHSEASMVKRWTEQIGVNHEAGSQQFRASLASRDPVVVAIVEEAGRCIGTALADLVNITDPGVIVVGGEAVSLGEPLLQPLRHALALRTFRAPPYLLPDWKDNSWARGAAALVIQKIFDYENNGGVLNVT